MNLQISSQAISKGSSIFTWLMYAELSTNCNPNEARNSATLAYSESVIDGQTFSIDLEKSFTLSKNLSSSWIALINRLRPNSISKLQDDSMVESRTNFTNRYINIFPLTLNRTENHDKAANSGSTELHTSKRNTSPSTASHKNQK